MNKKQMNELRQFLDDTETLNRTIGAVEERERIIKLLKDSDSVCIEWAIALIKGESFVSKED